MSDVDIEGDFSSDHDSSQHNSSSGKGSTNGTETSGDGDVDTIKNELTRKETNQVFRLRIIVIFILIAAGASVSYTVYLIISSAQREEFENEYKGIADKIIGAFQDVMIEISAVSGLAVQASAESAEKGTTWPFMTLSNFQERAGNAKALSGAIYISISPLVTSDQLDEWEEYVNGPASYWIDEGYRYQELRGLTGLEDESQVNKTWLTKDMAVNPVHTFDSEGNAVLTRTEGPYLPRWQTIPLLLRSMVNENIFENPYGGPIAKETIATQSAVLGSLITAPPGSSSNSNPTTSLFAVLQSHSVGEVTDYLGDPMSFMTLPIFDTLDESDQEVVAVLKSLIHWNKFLQGILPSTVNGINVVIENACNGNFTYEMIEGGAAEFVGPGSLHEKRFEKYREDGAFLTEIIEDGTISGIRLNQEGCPYSFHVYPSEKYYSDHITSEPILISLSVAAVFVFTIFMFALYDRLVERRQRLVLAKATQSTAIVASLFPKQVRDRLLNAENEKRKGDALVAANHKLKSFLSGENRSGSTGVSTSDQPIADLFPNCTVFFADIAGFTAWSSTREPAQVFMLLQSVYQAFDIIAKRRKVFKVETIGDSYVAVTGLPEAQPNHAVIMAKFAWDCLIKMSEITKELEVSLGPDTGDLSMRLGMHSGAVTAGVLKGERARFQLFGDTVNTAARMESTGIRGRIQISEATAHLLRDAGKAAWISSRSDAVEAKGKGVLHTYWLTLKSTVRVASSVASGEDVGERRNLLAENEGDALKAAKLKEMRLVDWVAEILLEKIKKLVIVHQRCTTSQMNNENFHFEPEGGRICLDEVKDVITMPDFDAKVLDATLDASQVEIPSDIVNSLKEYITLVAAAYRHNPFHNFEHACHVTMSVHKLLSRIVAPDLSEEKVELIASQRNQVAAEIHDFTHGLTSDPLAIFAIVFSALIHDVDHQGVSNAQLAKEEPSLSAAYRNKSIAEQNSVDVAWDLLMLDQFAHLRRFIFGTRHEMLRFRQLIVNLVLATDIFDKELGALRKSRWERAFQGKALVSQDIMKDLRATIVMEHIIQASDVCHTMQHWHVYQKWNRKLFQEMRQAWKAGRLASNPRDFWYDGELSFFDNYIIPLAKKLKECSVFGVSSDEYLGYAERNRTEWEARGREILDQMVEEMESQNQECMLTSTVYESTTEESSSEESEEVTK